jgi:hypothetical protein
MRFVWTLAAIVLFATSLIASPADYTFRNFVSTADGVYATVSNPAIDDNGNLVFNALIAGAGNEQLYGIFSSPNPAHAVALNAGDNRWEFFGRPALVDGQVAFAAKLKGDNRPSIYKGDDWFGDALVPAAFINVKDPVINRSGKVAYWGVKPDGTQGIFATVNLNTATIADSSTYSFFGDSPRITSDGTVAFIASTPATGTGIFTGPNPDSDKIVDSSGLIGGIKTFDINDKGQLIMAVQLDDESPALLRGTDPVTDQISLDAFGFAGEHLAINNEGDIVFDGQDMNGNAGIFTGPDSSADRIIAVGDQLFGQPLKDLFWDNPGFNEKGEIAFTYRLQDNTVGIAIATPRDDNPPTAIPLPAALPATSIVACAFAAHSTWRKLRASMRV